MIHTETDIKLESPADLHAFMECEHAGNNDWQVMDKWKASNANALLIVTDVLP